MNVFKVPFYQQKKWSFCKYNKHIDGDKVDATYDSGMLKVVMPKIEKKHKAKSIKVKKKGK